MEAARAEDIVPPGLLEIPSTEDCRGVWKEEAAVLLDGYLRRLVRQEARGRRVLGLLAGRLQSTRAYHCLGFARLGDYSRERLGLSGREVQSLSRTAAALENLPMLGRAFDDGRLCWTKARLLATVTDLQSQASWIEAAVHMNGAELQAAVKAAREQAAADRARAREVARADRGGVNDVSRDGRHPADTTSPGSSTFSASAASPTDEEARASAICRAMDRPDATTSLALLDLDEDDDEDSIDGEPRTVFELRGPRRLQAMWRRMVELARCMAGTELAQWQAAEAIAAEALTAREVDRSAPGRDLGLRLNRDDQLDGGCAGEPSDVGRDAASNELPSCFTHGRLLRRNDTSIEGAGSRSIGGNDDGEGDVTGGRSSDDDEYGDSLARSRAALDCTPLVDLAPSRIEALASGLDSLDPYALDSRMREVVDSIQRIDSQLGRLLFTFLRLTLHRELGFHDSTTYLRDRLGVTVRKARALVRLEQRSVHTDPALVEAYRRGDISWLRALVLLPIASESHGRAWVERAQRVTLQRLAKEVAWARELSDCARSTIEVAPPPLGCRLGPGIGMVGVPDPDSPGKILQVQIGARSDASDVSATEGFGDPAASSDSAEPARTGRVQLGTRLDVPVMFAIAGASDADWSIDVGRELANDYLGQLGARHDLPAACPEVGSYGAGGCNDGDRMVGDGGGALGRSPWTMEDLGVRDVCDGRIRFEAPASVVALLVDAVSAFTERGEAPWRGMERLLRHVEQTWQSLPRHRDPVFARDGWCCRVPACSSRRHLHDHHVIFRSQGGGNDRSNRVPVCAWHHHRAIHSNLIRAHGRADEGITWRIGLWRGRGPLMVLCDDTYVSIDERQERTDAARPALV
jgi:hypothetical protein